MRRRTYYIALAMTTIAIGLLIHLRGSVLGDIAQDILGDALYAMMIAWWLGAIAPNGRLLSRSVVAYAICAAIETSQLWHAPAIDAVRATRIGQLVLGSGFNPRDLAAYALGVAAATFLELAVRRKRQLTHS